MIFRKFIGWIISWLNLQVSMNEKSQKGNTSYVELQQKIQALEKLIEHMSAENEEIQTAFFRNIYHEIRTPMNSILGFSSLLHNENLTAEKRNIYSDQVWKSSMVFLQFIDDLVEASQLETQKTVLEPCWFTVHEMLQEAYQACNRHRHIMEKTNIAFLLNKSNFLQKIYAETDRKRLLQMIEYILTDCLTGMERGIIELGYKPILNNGLSFYIKVSHYDKKGKDDEPVIRRVGLASGNYGLQLRKRIADRLIALFGGTVATEHNNAGGYTKRIVISAINVSNNETVTECKSNKKRIAI